MLSFVLVDTHVVKVSGIVLVHVHHAKGRIDSRQAVPQPGPHPGKHLVADQVRDNFGCLSPSSAACDKLLVTKSGLRSTLSYSYRVEGMM